MIKTSAAYYLAVVEMVHTLRVSRCVLRAIVKERNEEYKDKELVQQERSRNTTFARDLLVDTFRESTTFSPLL